MDRHISESPAPVVGLSLINRHKAMIEMLISGAGLATRQVRTMTSANPAPLNTDSKSSSKNKNHLRLIQIRSLVVVIDVMP